MASGCLGANRRRGDVDAVLAEDRPHPADHARLVVVAEDDDVLGERHVEALVPDLDQMGEVSRAHGRSGHLHRLPARLDSHRDQLGELLRDDVLELGELDSPLLRDRGGVDQVHGLLGVTREYPDQHRDPRCIGRLRRVIPA